MELPERLRSYFPSYELADLDPETDHRLIITNILNFGDTDDVTWLFNTYDKAQIVNIVRNPSRGSWTKKALNYWRLMLAIEVEEGSAERALMDPAPRPEVYKPLFD